MKFYFRDLLVFDYIERHKAIMVIMDENDMANFNMCTFIRGDYTIIAEFFKRAEDHRGGKDVILDDIRIS